MSVKKRERNNIMVCPVCGRKYSFFKEGAYCSSECVEKAVKELEVLLESMEQEQENKEEKDLSV